MDFSFTPDQELLRDTARSLLGNESPTALLRAHMNDRAAAEPLWRHLREFAALGTGDATDLCVFLEQTGYVAAPGPFFASAALCAPLLAAIDHPALDGIVAGESVGTVAVAGASGEWAPNAEPVKYFVIDADLADCITVVEPGPSVRVITALTPMALREIGTVDSTRRCYQVGELIRQVAESSKERVAVLATGGLSHFPGSARIGEIDESFDHKLLAVMREGRGKSLVEYSVQDLLQAGDTEFLNWMVVIGAVGDAKASYTAYMPDFVATGWGFVSWKF